MEKSRSSPVRATGSDARMRSCSAAAGEGGGQRSGRKSHRRGQELAAADKVVEEIKALGGRASPTTTRRRRRQDSQSALDHFKRASNLVVNNAGILRDVSFAKMTEDDWTHYRVHVLGAYRVTHAAWPHCAIKATGGSSSPRRRPGFTATSQANYSMASSASSASRRPGPRGQKEECARECHRAHRRLAPMTRPCFQRSWSTSSNPNT